MGEGPDVDRHHRDGEIQARYKRNFDALLRADRSDTGDSSYVLVRKEHFDKIPATSSCLSRSGGSRRQQDGSITTTWQQPRARLTRQSGEGARSGYVPHSPAVKMPQPGESQAGPVTPATLTPVQPSNCLSRGLAPLPPSGESLPRTRPRVRTPFRTESESAPPTTTPEPRLSHATVGPDPQSIDAGSHGDVHIDADSLQEQRNPVSAGATPEGNTGGTGGGKAALTPSESSTRESSPRRASARLRTQREAANRFGTSPESERAPVQDENEAVGTSADAVQRPRRPAAGRQTIREYVVDVLQTRAIPRTESSFSGSAGSGTPRKTISGNRSHTCPVVSVAVRPLEEPSLPSVLREAQVC